MFLLTESEVGFMDEMRRVGARLTVSDWNSDHAQWLRAWGLGWEVVGMVCALAVVR